MKPLFFKSFFALLLWVAYLTAWGADIYPSPKNLRATPTEQVIDGFTLSFITDAYENVMPTVVLPDLKKDCTLGSLIVPIHFNVPSLPKSVIVEKVYVVGDPGWWVGHFNPADTSTYDGKLHMIARGCPDEPFKANTNVAVVLRMKVGSEWLYLRAPDVKLERAS